MKKLTQKVSIVALCLVMLVLSAVPAFAATIQHVEKHSFIDCIGQYKDEYEGFHYIIKVPVGTDLNCVTIYHKEIFITDKMDPVEYIECLGDLVLNDVSLKKSEGGYNYYDYYCGSSNSDSMGIKLYYDYGSKHYMATGAVNGATIEGNGYWLYV